MGPTGAPSETPVGETVLLAGGGLGNAVLFSIGKALRDQGSMVVYFAGYRHKEDVFMQEAIENATDQVVWAVDLGEPIAPRRPQDLTFVGNIVQAMLAYATGTLAGGEVVNRFAATATLTASPNPSVFGQQVTLTAHVAAVPPATATPSGSVDFAVDGTNVATAIALDASQNASFTTASLTPGMHSLTATYLGDSNFGSATNAPALSQVVTIGSAASITVVAGDAQLATVGTAFGQVLRVAVRDSSGHPVPNATVNFVAPSTGPSASITAPAVTDLNGETSVSATANHIAGGYHVTASAGAQSATFTLTNAAAAPAVITPTSVPAFMILGSNFQVTVHVVDAFGNPVPGVTVSFTFGPTGQAPSASQLAFGAVTDATGNAVATLVVNGKPQSYTIVANVGTVSATFNVMGESVATIPTLQWPMLLLLAAALLGLGLVALRR